MIPKHSGAAVERKFAAMQTFAFVMTAAFGCVVATGAMVLPGPLGAQKILAVGTGTLVTLLVACILASELKSRR